MKEREESSEVKAKDEGGIVGVNRERRQRVHKIREIWIVMNVARGGEGWRLVVDCSARFGRRETDEEISSSVSVDGEILLRLRVSRGSSINSIAARRY